MTLTEYLEREPKLIMWHSVKDILPTPFEKVIATDGVYVGEAYMKKSGYFVRTGSRLDWVEIYERPVTHWMFMPDPPYVESEADE